MSDAFSSCFALRMEIDESGRHYTTLCLPGSAIRMSPDQLSTLIKALGRARADMLPPIVTSNLHLPEASECTSVVDWRVIQDRFLAQAQVCLLHPGFGWLNLTMTNKQLEAFKDQLDQAQLSNTADSIHRTLMN